jgi:predicted amidohydrolase
MSLIKPYTAVGLIPTVRGIRKRADIRVNLEHLKHLVKAAAWLSSLDLPVRLIAIPEGALQGFNDEVLDLDHVQFAREGAIDIPGEETGFLGQLAREYGTYIVAQAKARHPEWKDRFFNVGFILDPRGEVILKHYKVSPLFPVEHSMCPHDVYDWWIQKYGRTLQAFWPVVDTEIGRLGIIMANEGSYPENARALALNGAEVVYRASYPHPATGNDYFEIQSRARALDNNIYELHPTWARITCSRKRTRRSIPSAGVPSSSITEARLSADRTTGPVQPTWVGLLTSKRYGITAHVRNGITG